MKLRYLFALLAVVTLMGFYSCEKDDDEPPVNKSISRLYISYSDFNPNTSQTKFNNVALLPFSDDSSKMDLGLQTFTSNAKGGRSIYFNPSAQLVFQGSDYYLAADTFIYKLGVGETGVLNDKASIPQNRLTNVRGMVFHPSLDKLYAINIRPDSSMLYVMDRPRGLTSSQRMGQQFKFNENADYWDVTIVKHGLVVSKSGTNGGIEIYDDLIISRDSTINSRNPSKILTVANANNIQGMSVDTVNNMLALTDFVDNGAASVGRILIFDDYSAISQATGTITPTRIITGVNTKLKQPIDVELDFRKDSKYVYVADKESKAVYRFLKTDNGNVAPNGTYEHKQSGVNRVFTPAGISLDARN
ncbi:hypothetical protein [Sphingobacterium daejeonense]|uniref:hypothetical protein n=1 Tax=Sphingobacterium daejeonense TaxID=371142 RepID=UPI0010C41922|nr:hypothetical protein [Sphingobacterium daejeonense]VTP90415.1 Uncharacterised protein [Sphingobacterium daejeonense]